MRKIRNVALTAAVITVGTFGAGSLFAQENAQNEKAQPNGMQGHMMGEDGMHGNMMGMMGQMHSMMEKCNAMMETMQQEQAEGAKTSA
ncbi:hypothetical protein DFO67_103255 [Modicisalibacter xianhensis]|uniref:Pentapeptide MXKDX repeat protein n=1 Tax=Modicisalibacter xianhensis TaxID=442341 RepID=A0A4R8FXH2_9GAMM|nr:hypothetical protein [Halomonas xianhensis]TDX31657.1 hypothetical protein DFO67_103255 [Halomonas xianhensis]